MRLQTARVPGIGLKVAGKPANSRLTPRINSNQPHQHVPKWLKHTFLRRRKMAMDVRKQKETIQLMARRSHMQWLKWFSMALSVVLLAVGQYTKQPSYFIFMILPLLIAFSAHQTGPYVRAASEAIRSGTQRGGEVKIEIDSSSDSDRFFATVAGKQSCAWRFEFIPLGWKPIEGQTQATLHALRGSEWPVLIEVDGGVMYPRYKPKQVSGAGGA